MYSDGGKLLSTIEIGGAMKTTDVGFSELEAAEDELLIEKQDGGNPKTSTVSS